MTRRQFITLLGGTAAGWPLVVRAQRPAIPAVGWLGSGLPDGFASQVAAFRDGLKETGFVEGKTVTIEFRWAGGQYDRLPALAEDLVRRPVAVILTSGGIPPTLAAKAGTSTIPIVFLSGGGDVVTAGLVASFNRPGGNVTGVSFLANDLATKQLSLLLELVPTAKVFGALVNPGNAVAESMIGDLQTALRSRGLQLLVMTATAERDIDQVFAGFAQQRPDALLVQTEPFLGSRLGQIAALAAHNSVPTIYSSRQFIAAGGLIAYGASNRDAYRQAGVYVGRILKGERPADLPILQPTRFELIINLKAAKSLSLDVPPTLLALADEVIE
jgi:putative ABC transport system substrate-binding protein